MSRILTGIQSTGVPHLGNILGAIMPAIELSRNTDNQALLFIADLHALTSIKDPQINRYNTYAVAATWLAFGFDHEKNFLYRQSKIPMVCELAWYLNCFTPYPMLANAHSFKDKSSRLADVNAGLFVYPVLMAADILLYDADFVPVGKDQLQHLEITRDIAGSFNRTAGETFIIPEPLIQKEVMLIPGTDGQKMSKSRNNYINVFFNEKDLKKVIMSIITDTRLLEDKKDPGSCNVFKLYEVVASKDQVDEMRENYLRGGYGYGHAKQALFQIILEKFAEPREKFLNLMDNLKNLEEILVHGEVRAGEIASKVLQRVRTKLGFN